jgi:F-type H+-transporting ATPase subunit a
MDTSKIAVFYFFGMPVYGYITTMWFIMVLLIVLGLSVSRNLQKVPGRWQALGEYALGTLLNFFGTIMGPEKARRYFPLVGTFFLFILFSNMLGLFPGSGHFTAFHVPTSTFSCTVAFALISFFAVQFIAIKEAGVHHYFKKFVSPFVFMLPLTIIEELVKPVSLSLRLYGNIYGGEMVAAVLLALFAPLTPIPIQLLDILFSLIQALVFSTLTAMYITLATMEH